MFISNLNYNKNKHYISNILVGNYLLKNGIPLLSYYKDKMVFTNNKELQRVLKKMPFYLKILSKVGDINE